MSHHINPSKAGAVLGTLLGGWHLLWALFVAFGYAQPIIDFVFWMHMLSNPYQVQAFNFTTAVTLVLITFVIGYILGNAFAVVWNRVHRGG